LFGHDRAVKKHNKFPLLEPTETLMCCARCEHVFSRRPINSVELMEWHAWRLSLVEMLGWVWQQEDPIYKLLTKPKNAKPRQRIIVPVRYKKKPAPE
jgi:hypothetical protein